MPSLSDWHDMRVRIGTVTKAEPNTGARQPAIALWIDFGDTQLQSSAKLTDRYHPEDLIGRQVVAVTGFEAMRVGGFRSDCLVLGALTTEGVVLLAPDSPVSPGADVA
jgi:tRNA-binding protein